MKVDVVMPAYNAGRTIKSVFERLSNGALSRISLFIVVDDGSKDDTAQVVGELAKSYKIKLVRHEVNKGYGAAQKTGFTAAIEDGADVAVLLHSDGQYAPELILEMIKPIENGAADVVGGSRILGGKALEGGMPKLKYYGNIFLTWLENLVFGMNLTTYHSGYKVYSRKALEKVPFLKYTDDFPFDSEMLVGCCKRANLKVVEVPIPTRYSGEKSYLNPWTYGINIIGVILRYLRGEI